MANLLLASDKEYQSGGDQDGFNDQDKRPLWESIYNAFAQERTSIIRNSIQVSRTPSPLSKTDPDPTKFGLECAFGGLASGTVY